MVLSFPFSKAFPISKAYEISFCHVLRRLPLCKTHTHVHTKTTADKGKIADLGHTEQTKVGHIQV